MRSLIDKWIKPKPKLVQDKLAWLAELSQVDDVAALQKTIQFLALFYDNITITPTEKIRTLIAIDLINRVRIDTIISQFSQIQNLRPELEKSYFETAYFYQRHLYRNYQSIISQYFSIKDSLPTNQQTCHLFIARALSALFESHKLRYFKLQTAPDSSWLAAYSLYQVAEEHELQDIPVKLYAEGDTTTISTILAQGCMLDTLQQSNLPKQKIEIASILLKKLMPRVTISKDQEEDNFLFFIDTKLDKGARRVRQNQLNDGCRFWATDSLSLKIHKVLIAVHQKKDLSATIIGTVSKHTAFLDTILFLDKEWSKLSYERQRRKEGRVKVFKKVTIVHGFEKICEQIRVLAQAISYREKKSYVKSEKSLDERLQSHSVILNSTPGLVYVEITGEDANIIDESNTGFALTVPVSPEKWAGIGKLIALSIQDNREQLIIGLIRSVRQLPEGNYYIGMEKLSTKPFWVNINHLDASHAHKKNVATNLDHADVVENSILGFPGLYFVSEFDDKNTSYLFMPRLELVNNSSYQLNLFGARHHIKVGTAKEIKDDWALTQISMLN